MEPKLTRRMIAVLAELLDDPGQARYGLEISQSAEVGTTTVYDILMRLEQSGWVKSHWESIAPAKAGRPRRRLYRLTGLGETSARAAIEGEIESLQLSVDTPAKGKKKPGIDVKPSPAGAAW